jgi:hypothetical protein
MKKEAVINFLTTLGNDGCLADDMAKAKRDARLYKWDQITQTNVLLGIVIKHEKGEKAFRHYLKGIGES